jgi:hypothetical protein
MNKNIILIVGVIFSYYATSILHAEESQGCPCDGGVSPYTVDCDNDGTPDACQEIDCYSCENVDIRFLLNGIQQTILRIQESKSEVVTIQVVPSAAAQFITINGDNVSVSGGVSSLTVTPTGTGESYLGTVTASLKNSVCSSLSVRSVACDVNVKLEIK